VIAANGPFRLPISANLKNSDLRTCRLENLDVSQADLRDTLVTGARFSNCVVGREFKRVAEAAGASFDEHCQIAD
jgi:uncharacterized protein YjbI with pentapeptide repeats